MNVAVLFSGGKDSGLTTLLLEPFFDEIELVTFSFGRDDAWKVAAAAAAEGLATLTGGLSSRMASWIEAWRYFYLRVTQTML